MKKSAHLTEESIQPTRHTKFIQIRYNHRFTFMNNRIINQPKFTPSQNQQKFQKYSRLVWFHHQENKVRLVLHAAPGFRVAILGFSYLLHHNTCTAKLKNIRVTVSA